ncbi:hypothetical protein Vretimale_16060 [Volvox reticuliferus]|uniref:SRCR domain-containing protein n=1 Tax=Volvox reticuliferus TaxID=1737510 RepID=A0A8J4CCZ1_9CHLO|nr:hypothetical protein Vretifemale_9677 [Volvox reticuliferus]GIM12845.1 hypothetical protein Vretimale_16060 [Volvox reticuliferus]
MALTLQQLFHLGVIAVLSLQFLGGSVEARKDTVYEKNGVRLVGGTKSAGRVEVLPVEPWVTNDWVQICDDSFSDLAAQNLCRMLGYRFGRKYYTTEIAFPINVTNIKAGYMKCYKTNNGRRLNEEVIMSGDDDDLAEDANHHAARQGRNLLAPAWGYVNNGTSKAPFICQFRVGTCNPAGPVAGLQCFKNLSQVPPAPPPPPSPPNPPPLPPAVANSIRIFTNNTSNNDGHLEPNLCNNPNTSSVCQSNGRVEIEVDSPDTSTPGKIWAPVCNVTDSLAKKVARLACEQRYQEKARPWLSGEWIIWVSVSPIPFYIPNNAGAVRAGDFNPAAVKGYVTITGGDFEGAQKLQDLQYQVSSKPCDQSAMFAFTCILMSNDGDIP